MSHPSTGTRLPPDERRRAHATALVLGICLATIVADGYDIVVFGAVVPELLAESAWGLDAAEVGLIGSLALVGMLIGALVAGTLNDRFGRRAMLIGSLSWFSVFTGLCAAAPSPEVLGALRLVAGLGLGGVLPTVSALCAEFSAPRTRNLVFAIAFSGFGIGGIFVALVGLVVIPAAGWRPMFLVGLLPLLVVVPVAMRFLPESMIFLVAKGRLKEAQAIADRWDLALPASAGPEAVRQGARSNVGQLLSGPYAVATVCFWSASALCLFTNYGLNTWLPQIMRTAGFSLGGALTFLLVYNAGAIVGMVSLSYLADRLGSKPTIIATLLLAAASVTLLSLRLPTTLLYVVAASGGAGAVSSQAFILKYVSSRYPARMGPVALGWTLGVGRLGAIAAAPVLGVIIGSRLALEWSFYAIAVPAVAAALVVARVPGARLAGELPTAPSRPPSTGDGRPMVVSDRDASRRLPRERRR